MLICEILKMRLQNYLAAKRGRQTDLAREIGIAVTFLYQIANGIRPVPIEYCAQIEIATNNQVTRKDLRPDDWQKIWPELESTHE